MKKIILFLLLIFSFINYSFAEYDFETDYTLIDCVDWNDNTAVAFDKNMPYQTLKAWIENTISYINSNINKSGMQETASGKVFNVKVLCTAKDMLSDTININFEWVKYNNKLVIEWINDNSLVFDNVKIKHYKETWNYEINNAIFKNYSTPIFIYNILKNQKPYSRGLIINKSIFDLKDNFSIWSSYTYKTYRVWRFWHWFRSTWYSYFNEFNINNSIINIESDNNSNLNLPVNFKNNKINFISLSENINDINISLVSSSIISYTNFLSNEIDFWGNNVSFQDNENIAFINNKFKNFNNISIPGKTVFLNNTFENENEVDISNSRNFFNNMFTNSFVDNYDLNNLRRNYLENDSWAKWIGWFYRRASGIPYFAIDLSSHELAKEITGIEIPNLKDSVYVIFNK